MVSFIYTYIDPGCVCSYLYLLFALKKVPPTGSYSDGFGESLTILGQALPVT